MIVLLPVARPLPLPVKVADEVDPEAISVTVPSVLPPTENVTLPVGAVLPLPGFTVQPVEWSRWLRCWSDWP